MKTITEQLRILGLNNKQIKRINNKMIHNGGLFKFANLSKVEFITFDSGNTYLCLWHKDKFFGFTALEKTFVLGK